MSLLPWLAQRQSVIGIMRGATTQRQGRTAGHNATWRGARCNLWGVTRNKYNIRYRELELQRSLKMRQSDKGMQLLLGPNKRSIKYGTTIVVDKQHLQIPFVSVSEGKKCFSASIISKRHNCYCDIWGKEHLREHTLQLFKGEQCKCHTNPRKDNRVAKVSLRSSAMQISYPHYM